MNNYCVFCGWTIKVGVVYRLNGVTVCNECKEKLKDTPAEEVNDEQTTSVVQRNTENN